MKNYVIKRLIMMVFTLIIIVFLVFYIIKLMPDYHQVGFGEDPAIYEAWREREGLNKPIPEQFFIWVRNIVVNGDFGYSFVKNRYVAEYLSTRLPETIKINFFPFIIAVPIGIALGIWAALKKNKLTDHIISTGVMFFISVPSFVVAVLLQYYMVYVWKIIPTPYVLSASEATADPWGNVVSRLMPTFVLAIGTIAGLTRGLRAELTETLTSEFMLLARAKGLSKRDATVRHALRNGFVPFAPAIIGGFISLLSGSLIIEQAFRIPGIGGVYLEALGTGDSLPDYPMVMVVMVFYVSIGLVSAIVGDLSYGFIDPRIKMGAGKQ